MANSLPPPLNTALPTRAACFRPVGFTSNISATTTSQSITTPLAGTMYGGGFSQMEVYNDASSAVFVAVGTSGVSASVNASRPIPSKAWSVMDWDSAWTTISAIAAAGTPGSIYFTPGIGQ